MGFIVAALVIILYVVMITKAIYVAKTAKDDMGSYIAIGIARNFDIPHGREYWNDYGIASNNWCAFAFCKLWRKFVNYKLYMYWIVIEY